jgi:hypothetical protein
MNTAIEKLLKELEKAVELHRKSADDLERRIKELREIAEEGNDVFLNIFVEKHKAERKKFKQHVYYSRLDEFEYDKWKKLHKETWINAAACAENEEEPN